MAETIYKRMQNVLFNDRRSDLDDSLTKMTTVLKTNNTGGLTEGGFVHRIIVDANRLVAVAESMEGKRVRLSL